MPIALTCSGRQVVSRLQLINGVVRTLTCPIVHRLEWLKRFRQNGLRRVHSLSLASTTHYGDSESHHRLPDGPVHCSGDACRQARGRINSAKRLDLVASSGVESTAHSSASGRTATAPDWPDGIGESRPRDHLDAGTVTLQDAKTDAGRRTVALPAFVVTALRDHKTP